MDIIVCDDHPVVRAGLIRIMSDGLDVASVREASNAQALLDLLRDKPGDVILLDIGLPGRSGLDVLQQIKQERPGLPVLILSVYPPEPYAIRAFRAGASGYVKKDSVGEELVKAVKTVVGGHRYVTPEIAESLAGDLNRQKPPTHDALTHREFEVMTLLASGRSVREVGEDLCLSYNTISTHRARILAKLGLKTSADLIKYAVTHKLVE